VPLLPFIVGLLFHANLLPQASLPYAKLSHPP
jgi:hypothetical protein